MKSKKTSSFLLIICAISVVTNLHAQMDNRINGTPSDFTMLKSRAVIVEIKEEDPVMITNLSKNTKNPNGVQHYKNFIANNNKMLKQAVDKYWKFNSSIQYKTTSELKNIIGTSNQYVIISYKSLNGETFEGKDSRSAVAGTGKYALPLVWYDRSERNGNQEPDDYIYLPVASLTDEASPECWEYVQSDYDFAIIQMQANIKYMISTNKKLLYEDYAKIISEANCGKMQNETLEIDNNQLDEKVDESAIKSFYKGPFILTDRKANNAFENHEQGKEIIFSFAYGIASGGLGMVVTSALYFSKAVVDCTTGELIYYYKPPGGMTFGSATTWQYALRKYLFYYMQKCK